MNRIRTVTVAAGAVAAAALAAAQIGGSYDLAHGTVETSGGASSGGPYSLVSAVNQPIAELTTPSTGGAYSSTSGFLAGTQLQPEELGDVWTIE